MSKQKEIASHLSRSSIQRERAEKQLFPKARQMASGKQKQHTDVDSVTELKILFFI